MKALAFSGGKDSMACLHLMLPVLDCAIYVDTGYAYPETQELVEYAQKLLPVHIAYSDRNTQNRDYGIPSDVVPVDWTPVGQTFSGKKDVTIQGYLDCCFANIAFPLWQKAKEIGATELISGERNEEAKKPPTGQVVEGITRIHPILDWTSQQVLDYLATKMTVPEHYKIKHSSLDCYDCPAYRKDSQDRIEWTEKKHPMFYQAYRVRSDAVQRALEAA